MTPGTIPDPTPEQRIAGLHRTFLTALDRELKEDLIPKEAWKEFVATRLPEVTTKRLAVRFTWLSVFGGAGRKPSRSWPIVGELSDIGRAWIAGAAALAGKPEPDVQRAADDARGRIHESLCRGIDRLVEEPAIVRALNEAQPGAAREALDLLAEQLTTLRRYRLFGEVPQEALYIPAQVKVADLRDRREDLDWKKVKAQPEGEEVLFQAIRAGHPRLVVVEGDMGAGKSCLMRVLAARLAEQHLSDRRLAPVFVRWRDVVQETDLSRGIADHLHAEHGLPFHDLPAQENVVYLIDGFDEMSSHEEGYVVQCFERLARLARHRCSVVVTMRSTVVTPGLRLAWRNREALAAEVQEFSRADVDTWAGKWRVETEVKGVTGERLRSLCGEEYQDTEPGLTSNPLLLYMLARYVEPAARERGAVLSRTEVFRTFVDETIRGKLRASGEQFFPLDEVRYRMLLQEIAYLASWPRHAPRCPARLVKERVDPAVLHDLHFEDVRTAFVLHFFQPGDLTAGEFEFQPEGFRQYLLAEWCVRAQLDAFRDEYPAPPLARTRAQAASALAQFPLQDAERILLDEIYDELGRLARQDKARLASRLRALGLLDASPNCSEVVRRLYSRVRREAEEPTPQSLNDERAGFPRGQELPEAFHPLRLLLNYWEQCLLATFGLYRGLGLDPHTSPVFERDRRALGRYPPESYHRLRRPRRMKRRRYESGLVWGGQVGQRLPARMVPSARLRV